MKREFMKYLDSAFVDKVRSDLRLRETQGFFKTDYSLVKNEYTDDSPKKSGSTGRRIKTETKTIKKEPKATQRTKVNWSTSKPKRSAANIFFKGSENICTVDLGFCGCIVRLKVGGVL